MKLDVVRSKSQDTGTPGILIVGSTGFQICTLELPWRNNLTGKSCIIADTYNCDVWHSPHLNRDVLRLEDKHGRTACLVHNGNFAGDADKGLETQVHGCTLAGKAYGVLDRTDGVQGTQYGILHSGDALDALLAAIGAGPHSITYSWAQGCTPMDLTDLLNTGKVT